jgi:hypothetical protein
MGLALVCGIALLAESCDTGPLTAGIDRGGVRSPTAVVGPITGFGSIYVNGLRFDIDAATIVVNGVPMNAAALAVGQIVTVEGELDSDGLNGSAANVNFEANVLGPIAAIDLQQASVTVLGQRVSTDLSTVFDLGGDPPQFASLSIGDLVEVSGFVGAGGGIVATHVERANAGPYRVRGAAASVDRVQHRFEINALVVDYGSAQLIEGFPNGRPRSGDELVAVGQALAPDGAFVADSLRLIERVRTSGGTGEAEIEGLITRFIANDDFEVSGTPVTTTSTTRYEGGNAADLALNVKVQVEGSLNPAGRIVASKVEIKDGGRVYDDD